MWRYIFLQQLADVLERWLPSGSRWGTKQSTEQSGVGIRRGMAKVRVLCEPFGVRRMPDVKMFSLFSLFLFDCSGGLSRHLSIPVFSVLGLFLCSGDGGSFFLQNVDALPNCTVLWPRRVYSLQSPVWEPQILVVLLGTSSILSGLRHIIIYSFILLYQTHSWKLYMH